MYGCITLFHNVKQWMYHIFLQKIYRGSESNADRGVDKPFLTFFYKKKM